MALKINKALFKGFIQVNGAEKARGLLASRLFSATKLMQKGSKRRPYANVSECDVRGINVLRNPKFNKGMAFSLKERQIMGIHGLLPPTVFSQEEQQERIIANFDQFKDDLDKFVYLIALQDRNEKLFYKVVSDHIEKMAPIIYTPTVGRACENFGFIFRKPRGLWITINDIGHVYDILCNWPEQHVKAIVVTDGERILGLGDLGAFGMGIPGGKLALYTALGGVPPQHCLPITIDVGTNNEQLLNDPNYIGLRHKRVRGSKYDELIDEFMEAVVRRWGQETLIQFEDFANQNAFRLLEKYRDQYMTFNDDIQGTASVALSGIMAATKHLGKRLSDQTYLFQGAGSASIGIANLLVMAMEEEGTDYYDAKDRIFLADSRGLVTKGRPAGGITEEKAIYAKDCEHIQGLEEICEKIKPSVAIGAAAVPKVFTKKFLTDMASFNERPIVFALSNPTSLAECTAEEAYKHTDGRAIFASGSPFDPVEINGKTLVPGQGNNAYIFPGVALGGILSGAHHITDGMFLNASQTLAEMVSPEQFAEGRLYPPLTAVREVSVKIAAGVIDYAYRHNEASHWPEPADKIQFVRDYQYSTDYESFVPTTYAWPGMVEDDER